jgi:inhibitor of cysteine peptidase
MTTLTEADDGRTIEIAAGQDVEITLRSNRTTGYRWKLVTPAAGVLARIEEPTYASDTTTPGALGVGGVERWSFGASRPGSEHLRFEYRRPWEPAAPATKTVHFTIRVK